MTETKNATTGPPTIFQVFADVKREVGPVGKDSRNQQQNFNFRGIDAVVNAAAGALDKHGVITCPLIEDTEYTTVEVGQKRTLMAQVRVRVTYRFYGPAGDYFDAKVPGEAMDSGDKGTAKAMSVAYRIALLQALNLPTSDADPDSQTYERSPARDDSWRSQPPVQREESRPPERSTDVDDGDWADWPDAIKAIASQEDADKLDAELREAFKAQRIGPTKANNIRKAIKDKAASLPPGDAEPERDMVAQRLGGEATVAQDTAALRKVHQAAMKAGKLQAFITLENGYAGTLLSYVTARKAELEPAKDGQAAAK